MKPLVAMVGWRGMVGSVLMKRMHEEHDFDLIRAKFFSTSNAGGSAPVGDLALADASDLDALSACDMVLTCQGVTIPRLLMLPCVLKVGTDIGSMLLQACGCKTMPS